MRRKRLLILLTEYYYFESHKQDLALAAAEEGYDVFVAARRGACSVPANTSFTFVDLDWKRASLFVSALRFLPELGRVRGVLMEIRPDVLHNIALKPAIMGSLAAAGQNIAVINSINGLGFVFYTRSFLARAVQGFCGWVLRRSTKRNNARIVLQNRDDAAYVRDRLHVPNTHVDVIRGSGVNAARFAALPEPQPAPVRFLIIGRLLFMKGIDIAVAAHQILRGRGIDSELVFAGGRDPGNPSAIPDSMLAAWAALPCISFLGHVDDIGAAIGGAHVVIQATATGEGLPKSLLEAAAGGRAIVATDVPGNREIVVNEETGLLVAPGNAQALADAMERLARDPAHRKQLGDAARAKVTREFSTEVVHAQHRQLYKALS